MKKIIKKLFTFFCVIILIFSFSGCNAISPLSESELLKERQNGITAIDSYLNEIRQMNLPYNLIFIEHEAKTAKEGIQASVSIDEIRSTTQNALTEMENLIAPDNLFTLIEKYNERENISHELEFYLGSYKGYYIIILKNSGRVIIPAVVVPFWVTFHYRLTIVFNDEGLVEFEQNPELWRYFDIENPAELEMTHIIRRRFNLLCDKIISGEIVLEKPIWFPKD